MSLLKRLLGLESEPSRVVAVDEANFKAEVADCELPVLLDAWSPGCAPCAQLAPVVINLAREYEGRLKVVELSTERAPRLAARLGIKATPTVIYFYRGRVMERIVGLRGSLYHREYIDTELLPAATAPDRAKRAQNRA
jgi:thioredoxin 1